MLCSHSPERNVDVENIYLYFGVTFVGISPVLLVRHQKDFWNVTYPKAYDSSLRFTQYSRSIGFASGFQRMDWIMHNHDILQCSGPSGEQRADGQISSWVGKSRESTKVSLICFFFDQISLICFKCHTKTSFT